MCVHGSVCMVYTKMVVGLNGILQSFEFGYQPTCLYEATLYMILTVAKIVILFNFCEFLVITKLTKTKTPQNFQLCLS